MKLTNITKCRECGGTSLTWDTVNRVNNAVQQGRLNTRDIQCVFFLGCDDCSETLAQISADTIAGKLNASAEPSALVERDERAEFDIEAAAQRLAACMDYPWEHMPEQGRSSMREHAKAVVIAALDGNVEPALLTRSAAADLSSLSLGDVVRKKSGSEWEGRVVGTYSTALTPEGYCVESSSHSGSVQIYPVGALERKP